jgi:peroxiredoxin
MNTFEGILGATPKTPESRPHGAVAGITVALAVSLMLNVLLAHRVRSLVHGQETQITDRLLKIGAIVPPISVKVLDGQQAVISYKGTSGPTVLYIFTPLCKWCARNMDNFKTLVDQAGTKYRFIGLSLSEEGLVQYVSKNELKIPVYSGVSIEAKQAYKLAGTPQTIVVSADGRVLQDWMGAYVGEEKSQVEAFFHATLPGIRSQP